MDLAAFISKARGPSVFTWYGDATAWRVSHRPYEMARQAGLDPPPGKLIPVAPAHAAKAFAYVRSESLTHGQARYRASYYTECRAWLSELGDHSSYFSNNSYLDWFDSPPPRTFGYTPLTKFVIDTGLIGISSDARCGFVFWRGEDD